MGYGLWWRLLMLLICFITSRQYILALSSTHRRASHSLIDDLETVIDLCSAKLERFFPAADGRTHP